MNTLSDFHFIRPGWLLLLPLVLLIWRYWQKSQDPLRGWRSVMEQELLAALTVGKRINSNWRDALMLIVWLLAVLAVAGPTWRPEPSPLADDPVPVMIALKAAETMDLTDMVPSRMERARLKVADFAAERQGQPLGLMAYAGSAHLVLPPTRDTHIVATMAAEISPTIMPKSGDDLISALEMAEQTLGSHGGSIVVVADSIDGGNENALANFYAKNRLPICFLAVARPETPEYESIQRAAKALKALVVLVTPDLEDIHQLVKSTARAPISITDAGKGVRWAEAGWWLVPVVAFLSLASFRRTSNIATKRELPA
jgi:Ca-activated chloride channel family protein